MLEYIKKNWIGLIVSIVAIEIIGFISGFFSQGSPEVYGNLVKPPLAPPSVLFGIVWPILYALIGVSLYRIYKAADSELKKQSLILFAVQLAVNVVWPLVFFSFMSYTIAALILIILDVLVIILYRNFKTIDTSAAYLLLPYLAWILFATYLNIGIVILN